MSRYPNDYQEKKLSLLEGNLMVYCRIKELREAHGYSQRQIAEQLGMLQPQYFRYETGMRDLPSSLLIHLANLYGVSIDYLLGQTDNPRRAE